MSGAKAVVNNRKEKRIKLRLLAGAACCLCGYSKLLEALDFHHLDPATKAFSIAGGGQTIAWHRMCAEVKKCILVCATCHREIEAGLYTSGDLEQYRIQFTDIDIARMIAERGPLGTNLFRPRKPHGCKSCGITVDRKALRCMWCYARDQERIVWPSVNELLIRVGASNYTQVAKELGVSDNAIRKRIRHHA